MIICEEYMVTFFLCLSLFSPQSSLTKFAESLQEMINYHTVCYHCHVKPDALSYVFFPLCFTAGWWQNSAGLTVRNSSLTVWVVIYCWEGPQQTVRQRKWSVRGWPLVVQSVQEILPEMLRCPWARHLNISCVRGVIQKERKAAIISSFRVGFHISIKMCLHAQQALASI